MAATIKEVEITLTDCVNFIKQTGNEDAMSILLLAIADVVRADSEWKKLFRETILLHEEEAKQKLVNELIEKGSCEALLDFAEKIANETV